MFDIINSNLLEGVQNVLIPGTVSFFGYLLLFINISLFMSYLLS